MLKSTDLRRGRTCVFLLHAHLVFVTKYRRVVFTPKILWELKDIFDSVCKDFGCRLVEFDGKDDHVHLLVNYPSKIAISSLVNSLKGSLVKAYPKKELSFHSKGIMGKRLVVAQLFCRKLRGSSFGNC